VSERLRSVGLDVGTTTTQLIVSELTVQNRASAFAVPRLEISGRQVCFRSPVYFTPLIGENLVDGEKIREIVAIEYEKAGIRREDVDTGAIIITGETSRRENARRVLEHLADFAGDFVVATAGPDLESVLAAKGAGAVAFSERTGKQVLHFDIGGGTSNWALIDSGRILKTGCLNVGGRLIKFDKNQRITYISPVLQGETSLKVGQIIEKEHADNVARLLAEVLEMAAGLRQENGALSQFVTKEAKHGAIGHRGGGVPVMSFSGGVADCVGTVFPWTQFGDLGPVLGRAIRESRLCRGEFMLGEETIRATVIGAGSHSAQLSGSTVFYQNVELPLKNLPVVTRVEELALLDTPGILWLEMPGQWDHGRLKALAAELAAKVKPPVYIALGADLAKALGHALALELGRKIPLLCIDGLELCQGDYLDIGSSIGPALSVVIKTLILSK
jgi:ethanolamine utilization protein EutA